MTRRTKLSLAAAAAVLVIAAAIVGGLLLTGGDEPGERPVLAIKIDNVAAARPQTGLGSADVIYCEPVEGGLTRLAAVYTSELPEVAGPVRSARETDLELLSQYGSPALAFSGAAPELGPLLADAPLLNVSPAQQPGAYFRDDSRRAPHNLYVRPRELPEGSGRGADQVLRFAPAPSGGTPVAEHTVRYPAARLRFEWDGQAGRWLVELNGTPLVSTETGQLQAATVVVQHVTTRPGTAVRDAAGAPSPVLDTIGTGDATVLRDGRSFDAGWSRPDPDDGTSFTTDTGQALPLAEGPVWILLVRA